MAKCHQVAVKALNDRISGITSDATMDLETPPEADFVTLWQNISSSPLGTDHGSKNRKLVYCLAESCREANRMAIASGCSLTLSQDASK
eukprot:5269002-Pyramimonas_sp.AAC.1